MARKSSGGGVVIIGLILLGLVVKFWHVFVPVAIVGLVVWLLVKMSQPDSKPSSSQRPPQVKSSGFDPARPRDNVVKVTILNSPGQSSSGTSNANSASPDSVWIPAGKAVERTGYSIPGGLIYFGKNLQSIKQWDVEPSLIDPRAPVDSANPDHAGHNLGYWPSYLQIPPASRAAYLEWLATGRKNPGVNIGYVFLYFYGLERRALEDVKESPSARNEVPLILAEVKRLLSIYGENHSFRNYASNFLDALQVSQVTGPIFQTIPQFECSPYEIPTTLKIALGQMAVAGMSLPVEWALAWAQHDPSMPRRTPVMRCPEEFRELFRIRYAEKFGEGIKLKPNKARIRATYYPASASFGGAVDIQVPDLPDLTAVSGPSSKISELVSSCTDELEGYSRYLGRNPEGKNSIEASSYMPKVLLKSHAGKEFRNLSTWLSPQFCSDGPLSLPLSSLLRHVPSISTATFGKKEATALANLLAKIDIGMEPDPRFGNFLPKPDQEVVLFKIGENAPHSPTTEYSAATVVLHLASAVAGADGNVDEDEERHLEEQLESWLNLSAAEQVRLRAHTQWLISAKPGTNGIKKRIEILKQGQRESLGRFLVGVAQADGYIDPKEMKVLTKIYEVLELNTQSLYSHAHAAAVEPVTVQPAELVKAQGYVIPKPPQQSVGVSLDMGSIEAKLAETVAVSAILNEIFTENEPAVEQTHPLDTAADTTSITGLDAETVSFMKILASKHSWAREELERLAIDHNVMLDGTLDTINDAAFDHFGGPFFEGDDPIEINLEFAREVSA